MNRAKRLMIWALLDTMEFCLIVMKSSVEFVQKELSDDDQ